MLPITKLLAQKTDFSPNQIDTILRLLDEGSTIPFIARYRKEMTGGATDEKLREFEGIYLSTKRLLDRKEEISRLIKERATLTKEIELTIQKADSMSRLEDIYRPFKEKKSSRATTAIDLGLEPLANILRQARLTTEEFESKAREFIGDGVASVDDAISGAKDILAQEYAELPQHREVIRRGMMKFGLIRVKKGKNFDESGSFKNFIDRPQKVSTIPSHRYLAIMRGVKEKELSVAITIDTLPIQKAIREYQIPKGGATSSKILFDAYYDGFKRLLLPSVQREIHTKLKERSDDSAIGVFGKNLHQLLMTPPVSRRVLLGVDPAFRTGCKLAVIDEQGNYLDSAVIYPTQPTNDYKRSKEKIVELTKRYNIRGVAIGNGTGSQETQAFFARLNKEEELALSYTVVSEAGASVYSASKIAMEEYPELDVTIRGAISIAQRLRDPMATLVKIDPKSLGIGQYQHDLDQKNLAKKLSDVTEDIVNRVGVDINSASLSLLSYIAGITPRLAQNIIDYRQKNGDFTTKEQLLKVKGIGAKAYEQSAGFIRIKDGNSTLDNSGIHPESYHIAKELERLDLDTVDIGEVSSRLGVGRETLKDIIKELQKPGFDPRDELPSIPFKEGIIDIDMISEGSFVSGVVRNIADFGAFVDIGLKNDGMIHISKMSSKHIKHPLEVLSLNQYLPRIEVISVEGGRVGLSLLGV